MIWKFVTYLEIAASCFSLLTATVLEADSSIVTLRIGIKIAIEGTAAGLVGGSMAIAEQIRKWYVVYKQRQDVKRIEKVLIVTPNGRFLLENATTEEIAKALEPLAK